MTEFPEDLSGHFWTTLEHHVDLDRYVFSVIDYQNNVLLRGVAVSIEQASQLVNAWDRVVAAPEGVDPSLPSASGSTGLVEPWATLRTGETEEPGPP